jgi:hypothetical protein
VTPRRFPPPWRVVELPGGYAVEDANGQRLGTFYGRADPRQAGSRWTRRAGSPSNFAKADEFGKSKVFRTARASLRRASSSRSILTCCATPVAMRWPIPATTPGLYLDHKNIQHTVRYIELSPARFKNFWR